MKCELKVTCPKCNEEFKGQQVKIEHMGEDPQGRDVVLFDCPKCKAKLVKSLVIR